MGALDIPREPVNTMFARAFSGEASRGLPKYRRGLSLIGLACPA
jgi:hypothetical protein